MITQTVIKKSLELIKNPQEEYFSRTRDIFSARLDSYIARTGKYLESAIIGEIGNNSFDHNFTYSKLFLRGTYFNPDFIVDSSNYIVLADFGRGVLDSLKVTVPHLTSDEEALHLAFTQVVSGRSPEQRGNGLKFVLKTTLEKKWDLFYTSGNAFLTVADGKSKFSHNGHVYHGCMAIIHFGE